MRSISPNLLLSSYREEVVDEEYFGFIFLYENFKRLKSFGDDNNARFYLRSLSKPIQASLIEDFNLHNILGLTQEEIAICCASHSGTKRHCELVKSILNKAGLDESYLKCPKATALDKRDFGEDKKEIYHNCSAKHAFMLCISKARGWSLDDYLDFEHPLQQLIKQRHLFLSSADDIKVSLDGCGAPVFALRIDEIARMFFNFFNDEKYSFIKEAIVNNPYVFGGYDRLDSEIVELGNKNLVAKVGAGGFLLVYNIKEDKILIIKMSQNNNVQRRIIALNALYQLSWIDKNPSLNSFFNDWGKKVGEYFCNFSFL